MTQLELYKSFQFVCELLIAETLFSLKLVRRRRFYIFLPLSLVGVFLFSWLLPVASTNAFYISFMFFMIFAVTVLAAKATFGESWIKIVFCMLAGYTVQHLAYEFYNISLIALGANKNSPMGFYGDGAALPWHDPFIAVVYFFVYFVTYFFAMLLFGRKIEGGERMRLANGYIFVFAVLLFVVDIVLNAVVVFYIAPDGNSLYMAIAGVYNVISCVTVLLLMFEAVMRYKLEDSLHAVNLLRRHEKEQYAATKENIELINMKCHDLKHQIRNIGSRNAMSEESIKEIEDVVRIYDSALHTGNDALDVILTDKMLSCNKHGIKFSCIVDGKQLAFMREGDIYSLFGNLIDNSIEAVLPLEESMRVITLKIIAVENLVSVNLHNYYEKDVNIEFENGLPQTTKSDKRYHGYGMKSVKYICDRYNGDLSINAANNVFNINILFMREADL